MRAAFGLILPVALLACSPVQEQARTVAPMSNESVASIGDRVIRVDLYENLPNLFGRADILGRSRPRGFSELTYQGIDLLGNPRFHRRDVDLVSTQTTMSESGLGIGVRSVQRTRDGGQIVTTMGAQAPPGRIGIVPPTDQLITLDLADGNALTVHGRIVEVLYASATLLRYRVHEMEGQGRGAASDGSTGPGTSPADRRLPQNEPKDWKGIPAVRPPP